MPGKIEEDRVSALGSINQIYSYFREDFVPRGVLTCEEVNLRESKIRQHRSHALDVALRAFQVRPCDEPGKSAVGGVRLSTGYCYRRCLCSLGSVVIDSNQKRNFGLSGSKRRNQ